MKPEVCYQAMLARDYRFDGRFFVGVKTTGVYCRPICPARPKRENVEFFPTALAAESKGFRPCLRCRPECAPQSPAWLGKSALVQRVLRLISAEGYFATSEEDFAQQFGVSARHLRRLFVEEIGLTPKQIAGANRLNFARKLVVESRLPMTTVALTAGFSSLRRFNDAFKKRFRRNPRDLRKSPGKIRGTGQSLVLTLSYRPPLPWKDLLGYFRSHQVWGSEVIFDSTYQRIFKVNQTKGLLKVTQDESNSCLKLAVEVGDPTVLFAVTQKVRRMFDLDSDPLLVGKTFENQKFLHSLVKKNPGLRVARGWDPFETAVCTVLGQLVSVPQARAFVRQLVEAYGEPIEVGGVTGLLFPTPQVLQSADLSEVRTTAARKSAIRELASRVSQGKIDLAKAQPHDLARQQLLEIPGIGPWSAEYIALRALGDSDAFPKTDLLLKRSLKKHPEVDLEKMRPWRSYGAIYLWRHEAQPLKNKVSRLEN